MIRYLTHLSRAIAVVALVLITACGGDKTARTPAVAAAAGSTTASANGEELYGRCMACHQSSGTGMAGAFPPLAGSEWVNGPVSRPIAIVLHGVQGSLTVAGSTYNGAMMPYGTNIPMNDAEVAAVLTYVRTSFGNSASPVTAEQVAQVRAATMSRTTPLTQRDLEALQ
jgi:mono/diheme cytochrome c family protein